MQEDLFIISKVDLVRDNIHPGRYQSYFTFSYFYCNMSEGCDIIICFMYF